MLFQQGTGRDAVSYTHLTEPRIAGETACGKHHAALGAKELLLTGRIVCIVAREFGVEAVFGARSDARHSAGIIDHKGIHFRAVHDRDIHHAFERFEHRQDIAGTVACR